MSKVLPPLDTLKPDDAWQPWTPDARQPWDLKWAAHLYRRAAFGATLDELRAAVPDGFPVTLERLLSGSLNQSDLDTLIARSGESISRGGDVGNLRGWWLYAILHGGHPLREKMTLFWHNHFATSNAKVRSTGLMFRQNQSLRRAALGHFGAMLADLSRDPAMLIWLDSNRNVKGAANENFARELLELFALGVGHYSERDVREAARAFTGWHTDGEHFTYTPRFHDDGEKTLLERTGRWDGVDVQKLILDQPAAAMFLVRKLYGYLVSETAEPPEALLEPLAIRYRRTDYDTGDLVATILRSRHFYSDYAYRQRVKSPVEHIIGLVRVGRPGYAPRDLVPWLEQMGQPLFTPPNVKGWTGGKSWLNSATVLARQNFAEHMVGPPASGSPKAPPSPGSDAPPPAPAPTVTADLPMTPLASLVRKEQRSEPGQVAELLADLFLNGDMAAERRAKLVAFLADDSPKGADWVRRVGEAAHALVCSPEFHLA
ncbi:MAG TPA: DUF1800 domain-containing protein [Gemmataceae bacterium]|jgi:hypothetical protein|nr:DUF1800 domain-containing protein [Gemmataceae bacterium]